MVEMRMLHSISEHTRKDKFRDEFIREKVGMTPIKENIL